MSEEKKAYDFKTNLNIVRNSFPNIVSIDDTIIDKIQAQIDLDKKKRNTNSYLSTITGASLTIIFYHARIADEDRGAGERRSPAVKPSDELTSRSFSAPRDCNSGASRFKVSRAARLRFLR